MARADRIDPDDRLNRFAELLSLDLEIPDICRRMGIGRISGYKLLMKLRKRLGRQAV